MSEEISLATQISIRDAGLDEYWLQNQIVENPAVLGMGDLVPVAKERKQGSGGILDILLKNPEDDTMYEVEVMLGETDETHIIRTIEYYDNEKRIWPKRTHIAVLVAEHINRRFFNVIQLLSNAIPVVAIQASLLETDGKRSLFFSKILDSYEEVEDGSSLGSITYNREHWETYSPSTLENAQAFLTIVQQAIPSASINFVKYYIAVVVDGNNYFWFNKRSKGKSLLGFRMAQSLQEQAAAILDQRGLSYIRKPKEMLIAVDKSMIEKNADALRQIAELAKKTWQKD